MSIHIHSLRFDRTFVKRKQKNRELRGRNENRKERGVKSHGRGSFARDFVPVERNMPSVVKMKTLSRYQSAGIFQAGEAYIAEEEWAHFGRLTVVAVAAFGKAHCPFSIPFSRHAVTTLLSLLPRRSIFTPFMEK